MNKIDVAIKGLNRDELKSIGLMFVETDNEWHWGEIESISGLIHLVQGLKKNATIIRMGNWKKLEVFDIVSGIEVDRYSCSQGGYDNDDGLWLHSGPWVGGGK